MVTGSQVDRINKIYKIVKETWISIPDKRHPTVLIIYFATHYQIV